MKSRKGASSGASGKAAETKTTVASKKAAGPKAKSTPAAASTNGMEPIKKLYTKSKNTCKVTFSLPAAAAAEAKTVSVVGDFNGWDESATPLKLMRTGKYTVTMELEKDREYRFRFCIDGCRWENHWNADAYLPNPHGGEDSIVKV